MGLDCEHGCGRLEERTAEAGVHGGMTSEAGVVEEWLRAVRGAEAELLSDRYAAMLAGNQAIDFLKQDGITEIEESVQANCVERRMNDMLLADEQAGMIRIGRAPALIACVSNFSNFLDLFRKTVRQLELGVPCLVLSRTNTSQHCYRWFLLLQELALAHGLPKHLVAFASCSVEAQRGLMARFPLSPVHFTGSREVARNIKAIAPRTLASTGRHLSRHALALSPPQADSSTGVG